MVSCQWQLHYESKTYHMIEPVSGVVRLIFVVHRDVGCAVSGSLTEHIKLSLLPPVGEPCPSVGVTPVF